jgi:topoisomerase (DNA) II binding protein 1
MSTNISVVDKSLKFKFILKNKTIEQATEQMQIAYQRYKEHVDIDSHNAEVIGESQCLKIEKSKLNKKTVFIFEEFAGTAFDYIKGSKALLIGPRCLTRCLVDDLTIPFIGSPVLNLAMRGMIVTASGMLSKEKERIKELVSYMGGQYIETLTANCTHLVASTVRSVKYEKAGSCHMKIMHPDWLKKVFDRSQNENILASNEEFEKYKLPIFFTLNITSTNLLVDTKNKVKKLIETHGGQYMGSFKSEVTDILILDKDKTDSEKFHAAIRYSKDCLTPQWVFDSVEKQYALPIGNYKVGMMKVSTPTKSGVPNSSAFNPDCTQLSEISHGQVVPRIGTVNETVVSVASTSSSAMAAPRMSTRRNDTQTHPAYKAVMQRLNVKMAKKAGPFLDGCNVSSFSIFSLFFW